MNNLTEIQIKNIKHILEEKIKQIQNVTQINNKLWPQLELSTEMIYRLDYMYENFHALHPVDSSKQKKTSQKIPTGKYSFVILCEEPFSVYCFSHEEVYACKKLRMQAHMHVNYGHSSLTFIKNKQFSRPLLAEKMAKPVLLAGNLYFGKHEHLALGGGEMISWTVESGHYRPSEKDAYNNRIGYMKKILPIGKFNNIFPDKN
ncbi:hypothetical protein [Enterobacter mori]|uniref:hypothetical protein n=1 Tax=Enterobacter mori TaxID=539813 RepID=UPI003B83CC48